MTEAEKALYADVCWLKAKLEERRQLRTPKTLILEAIAEMKTTMVLVEGEVV